MQFQFRQIDQLQTDCSFNQLQIDQTGKPSSMSYFHLSIEQLQKGLIRSIPLLVTKLLKFGITKLYLPVCIQLVFLKSGFNNFIGEIILSEAKFDELMKDLYEKIQISQSQEQQQMSQNNFLSMKKLILQQIKFIMQSIERSHFYIMVRALIEAYIKQKNSSFYQVMVKIQTILINNFQLKNKNLALEQVALLKMGIQIFRQQFIQKENFKKSNLQILLEQLNTQDLKSYPIFEGQSQSHSKKIIESQQTTKPKGKIINRPLDNLIKQNKSTNFDDQSFKSVKQQRSGKQEWQEQC